VSATGVMIAEVPIWAVQLSSLQKPTTWFAAEGGQAVWIERTESQLDEEPQRLAVKGPAMLGVKA